MGQERGSLRLGILTQWYDPEPGGAAIPGALARELSARGHQVTVLTGFPNYPSGSLYPGFKMRPTEERIADGVRVRRVALYPSHDSSAAHRAMNYGSFALTASTLGLPALRGLDAVWVYNSPASVAVPMWAARFLLRIPHVLHIMDLWPDSIMETAFGRSQAGRGPLQRGLQGWCNAMYRSASSVAYITPGVGRELESRGVPKRKLEYVPVWADATVARAATPTPRSTWGVGEEDTLLLYAGTMGEAQGLDSLIDALAFINGRSRITCLMAGMGTALDSLKDRALKAGLTNIKFIGQVPRDQMPGIMAAADVHIVMLKDTPLSRITMPSKIQTTLASGKPFIAALGGDSASVARDSGAGFLAQPGDASSLADALLHASSMTRAELRESGARGRDYYDQHFSLIRGVDRIEELLAKAASRRT